MKYPYKYPLIQNNINASYRNLCIIYNVSARNMVLFIMHLYARTIKLVKEFYEKTNIKKKNIFKFYRIKFMWLPF